MRPSADPAVSQAATARSRPQARLLRGSDLFIFVGPLADVSAHVHQAAALLISVNGPFRIRRPGGNWSDCQGALLPAGQSHELQCDHQTLAVIYLDAIEHGTLLQGTEAKLGHTASDWVRHGRRLVLDWLDLPAAFATATPLREQILDDILPRTGHLQRQPAGDNRLLQLRNALDDEANWQLSLPAAAQRLGLSRGRFSHLFSERVGLGWTAYRNWTRLIDLCSDLVDTPHAITRIAIERGYSSAAHFTASFRHNFGITPSQLRNIRPSITRLDQPIADF